MTIIWTAAIDHKHGTTLFAATTEDGIYKQLADYCRQWWNEVSDYAAPGPALSDREIVDRYFEVQRDRGDEWHVVEETPLFRSDP